MQYLRTFLSIITAIPILCLVTNLVPNSYPQFLDSAQAQAEPLMSFIEADPVLVRGVQQANNGELQEAADTFQRVLALSKYNDDRLRQEISLNNLAVVYSKLGQYDKAVQYYQQAFDIVRNPDVLLKIGRFYLQLNERSKAVEYYQKAIPIYRQNGDTDRETDTLIILGDIYLELSDSSRSLLAYQQALEIYQRQQNCQGEDEILEKIGQLYERIGQNNRARQLYRIVDRQQADRTRRCVAQIAPFSVTANPTILLD